MFKKTPAGQPASQRRGLAPAAAAHFPRSGTQQRRSHPTRACSPLPFASAAESGPRSTIHRLRPEPDTRAHARTRELESELNPSRQATPWTPGQPHASQDPGKPYRSLFDPFRRPCVSAGRFGSRRGARAAAVFSARFSHRKSTPSRATFSPRNPTRTCTRLTNRGDL